MSTDLKGLNVYLIGMMGAGKTTVGRHLAKSLGYRFVDTDQTIMAIAKKSIADIFAESGEAYFRDLESKVLSELSSYTRSLISTGGGIIQTQMNWSYLRQGLIIWLDVELEILKKRVAKDQSRPLADKLESLLAARRPLYEQADIQVKIQEEQSASAISAQIRAMMPTVLKSEQ
ncbi:MAG: shikimate kinase [Cyanobacteria bacterium J06621_8]